MNRFALTVVALFIALAIVVVKTLTATNASGREGMEGKRAAGAALTDGGSKARRAPKDGPAPVPAREALQALLDGDSPVPRFDRVDDLARRLSKEDLAEFIETIEFGEAAGSEGWVRSALYAEWGRRDPATALAYLNRVSERRGQEKTVQQALFAVYRGWAEGAPMEALEGFLEVSGIYDTGDDISIYIDRTGARYTSTELFRRAAQVDREAAWSRLSEGGLRAAALDGFFQGLPSRGDLDDFVARWEPEWNAPEAVKAHEAYTSQIRGQLSGWITVPREDLIARSAADALARFDPVEAEAWIDSTGPGDQQMRNNRIGHMWNEWAHAHPREALARLRRGEEDRQSTIARGIILEDPELTPAVLAALDNPAERARALTTTIHSMGSHHVAEFFPVPGRGDRLRDLDHRYEQMRGAIEGGGFQPGQEQVLLRSLNGAFRSHVAAAREAYEAQQGGPDPH